ncbi:WRKY DNA-binding protein [Striga asiatica]|uniref:WRKY DNA-binding protein n=1 Tax=Striga asiatica TaxID=4170 RepID=A0A5A7PH23_STRAF|nr:WRKY DNA-binding protein [Striga asiatica]
MAENYQNYPNESTFEVSDFFEFNDWAAFSSVPAGYNELSPPISDPNYVNEFVVNSSDNNTSLQEGTMINNRESGIGKKERRERVAFKTKSEVEVLDDGFKWRKYGKKMVKNSPNPRNYYKCSMDGCPVKKQVERDKEDPRYVLTTYEGVHNHP